MGIPIYAAERLARDYGYDQIVVIGRKIDTDSTPGHEHVTTYGVNEENCEAAALIGNHLKYNVMKWPKK